MRKRTTAPGTDKSFAAMLIVFCKEARSNDLSGEVFSACIVSAEHGAIVKMTLAVMPKARNIDILF
jgi:hypothetical protein